MSLEPFERQQLIDSLDEDELEILQYDWSLTARDNQLYPTDRQFTTWLLSCGRGWGKTLVGAQATRFKVETNQAERIALVSPTAADGRDVMVEGESGLLSIFPRHQKPKYEPSKRRITFHNGAIATLYSAEEPDRLRGPQHDFAWLDEVSSWKHEETYDMLVMGLRLGVHRGITPQRVATTTPKPTKLVKRIIEDPRTFLTRGSTYENAANLAADYLEEIKAKYEGTRLGRQEIYAELLEDNPGALWNRNMLESCRIIAGNGEAVQDKVKSLLSKMRRIVIGVDPATTNNEDSDETGIIVCGIGDDGLGYVFDDLSLQESPLGWAKRVCGAYARYGADRVVIEVNQGGDMVGDIIRQVEPNISIKGVRAKIGKLARAEPIAALYEQGRIRHVGTFGKLEDQMCDYNPNTAKFSPDRMDALVWALTDLFIVNNNLGMLDYMHNSASDKLKLDGSEQLQKELQEKRDKLKNIFGPKPKME